MGVTKTKLFDFLQKFNIIDMSCLYGEYTMMCKESVLYIAWTLC